MGERRQLGKRGALLLGGLATLCILALGVTVLFIPPRMESHQDQVAYALAQHGVAYEQFTLSQSRQDVQNYYAYAEYTFYGAEVIVRLPNARQARGRIECRLKNSRCSLYLAALGISPQPLPDLDTGAQWFWVDWLRQIFPTL
jgi:hypothetical protein